MTLDADGLEPGDVCFCSLPDLGYKATVRVADIIIQSQTDGTTAPRGWVRPSGTRSRRR